MTKTEKAVKSQKDNQIKGILKYNWTQVLKGLDIGNRPEISGPKPILNEDVIESRILSDGSLYTKKLIRKPLGSGSFLNAIIGPFGLTAPKFTNVLEESLANPAQKTCWQWSRNIKGKLYMGYEEREWLEMSERAIYLPKGNATFYKKDLQCRCYINIYALNFCGVPNMLTTKGSTRWETRSSGQIERLIRQIEKNNHITPHVVADKI